MEHLQEYWLHYSISNTIGLVVLYLAWKKPSAAKVALGIIFLGASVTNTWIAISNPSEYLEYRQFAVLEIYRNFIDGWFAEHARPFVLCIAAGQFLIGVSMFVQRATLTPGLIGVIVFGLAIAPLGIGSGFPCTIVLATSALILLIKSARNNSLPLIDANERQ